MAKISTFDKINASTLMLVTSERSTISEQRRANGYNPSRPTYTEPAPLPIEFATISGTKIRYAKSLKEGAPTVLLLCPLPQSIIAFAPIWKSLTEHFNLYTYDLPGFGRSEGGNEYMTFKAQGEFLNDFIEHFNLDNIHIMGPDIGMPAALYYAAQANNKVKSLMIGDGPAINPSSNGSIIRKMAFSSFWRAIMKVAGAGALVEAGNRIGYVNYVPNSTELSDYKDSYNGRIGSVLQWFIGYPKSLKTMEPLLPTIDKPSLIFWGDKDMILFKDNGERLNTLLPNSQLHIFENCGHFSYQDQHEQFAKRLVEWVNENEQ